MTVEHAEYAEGDKVVAIVPKGLNPMSRVDAGSVGQIETAKPEFDYYEVSFSGDRLYVFPSRQLRLATSDEVEAGFAVV